MPTLPFEPRRFSLLLMITLCGCMLHAQQLSIDLWHGLDQRVGHLGKAQDDFNVMGHVSPASAIQQLTCQVNEGTPFELSYERYRRIARDGDFNADIPINSLTIGDNTITIAALSADGTVSERDMTVRRVAEGSSPLPMSVDWGALGDPQQAGQYVDGKWRIDGAGLRTDRTGYDRLFLIGNTSWRDYDVAVPVTIHSVNGPGPGVGVIMRFAGHVVGGPLNAPDVQPKWGYLPFGGMGWLRWDHGQEDAPPHLVFHVGNTADQIDFGEYAASAGETHTIRMQCKTLPPENGRAVTRFRFKAWPAGQAEPAGWAWEYDQQSNVALQQGGCALVAHYVDATFGDVSIRQTAAAAYALRIVRGARMRGPRSLIPGLTAQTRINSGPVATLYDIRGRRIHIDRPRSLPARWYLLK